MKIHPLAEYFPELDGEDFLALVEDIRTHGLREPITLFDGAILDGRNRARACQAAGVEARFVDWQPSHDLDTPVEYVISVNLRRRHCSDDVRALIAEQIADYRRGGAHHPEKFTTIAQAARLLNVSESRVIMARDIVRHGEPADIEKVQSGASKIGAVRAAVLARVGKTPTKTPATIAKEQHRAEAAQPDALPRLLAAIEAARRGLKLSATGEQRGFYNTVQRVLKRATAEEIADLERGAVALYDLDVKCQARHVPTLDLKAARGLMAQITACSDRLMLLDAIEDRAAKLEAVPELVDRIGKDRRREVLRKVVGALRLPLVSGSRWEQSAGDAKPPAETAEEFLARGGEITRMPTAIVGPSTGQIPPGERDAIVAHIEKRATAASARTRAARARVATEASASAQRGRNIDAALLPGGK